MLARSDQPRDRSQSAQPCGRDAQGGSDGGINLRRRRQRLVAALELLAQRGDGLLLIPHHRHGADLQPLRRGREVSLEVKTTDRYGRSVTEVISDTNINLVLVEDGQAFAYRQYLSGCDAKEYLDAEHRASRRRYGIWQVPGGITRPWDFRRGRRSVAIPDGTTPGGRRYRCGEISFYDRGQELLRQGHTYLDGNGDGEACEILRR
ncbi:thermonuclease family protein [Cyanobium sp. Alchichica 3B3-8F6]|nr:thermonuclease family protein [Cyanobium sp. Alchichica 3B3-8F6]